MPACSLSHLARLCQLFVCVTLYPVAPLHAALPSKGSCNLLLRQKKYAAAGSCFHQLAEHISTTTAAEQSFQRRSKSLYLRTGARAYAKAAKLHKVPQQRAYYYEQAAKMLGKGLRQRLYRKAYQRQKAERLRDSYLQAVGYAQLALNLAGSTSATLTLQGHAYRKRVMLPPNQILSLRPGRYTLTLRFKGSAPQAPQVVVLAPKQKRFLTFHTPPKPRVTPPKAPPLSKLPLIVGSISGVTLVAGGVMLGLGYYWNGQSHSLQQSSAQTNELSQKSTSEEVRSLAQRSQAIGIAGWALVSVGTLGAGIALFLRQRQKAKLPQRKAATASTVVLYTTTPLRR